MNTLMMLLTGRPEAEMDAAVWIDDQPLLRPVAALLAHHRTLHAAVSAAIGAVMAPVTAVVNAATTAGNIIDRAHATAGEGTAPCRPCVTAEADGFAGEGALTYTDVCHAWDLTDGGLA